jgi:hypothetical protein
MTAMGNIIKEYIESLHQCDIYQVKYTIMAHNMSNNITVHVVYRYDAHPECPIQSVIIKCKVLSTKEIIILHDVSEYT